MTNAFFRRGLPTLGSAILASLLLTVSAARAAEAIPHAQDKPPGPALSPQEAIAKMKVPNGFHVELVASEPDIINPVAMAFDERGRTWITESVEYPRREPGAGRDRIKILEDTDGDGKADKFTIFAEGLNIPSGIAVGYGGVWVANSPDILFLQDTDGDGKADKREVVATGFGRDDTHELPNSLTWGPDGWLYGLNGVFNYSKVVQNGKTFEFTCALFRINARTREFQLFCEGTSNPWGVAWDSEGSAFISACVIDHLWHLTETGYYIRQGGPYPPNVQILPSIVKHKHQKAAYCGIHYYDSDAYPAEFRNRFYMGNIHGGCLNVDFVERNKSTYFGKPNDDFLTANDAWFMPVVQKTGPDGCLWVLDWYDRYHCYQDAGRDPQGIDRLKGRLYRVCYGERKKIDPFDLAKESDAQLIERLKSPNGFFRDMAQRVLSERASGADELQKLVLDAAADRRARLHALWALVGAGPLDDSLLAKLLTHDDATFRAWAVRAAGNSKLAKNDLQATIIALAKDPAPDVRLQVAIAARKLPGVDASKLLLDVLRNSPGDDHLSAIVWQNLSPLLDHGAGPFLANLSQIDLARERGLGAMMPRVVDRVLSQKNVEFAGILQLIEVLQRADDSNAVAGCLRLLFQKVQTREIGADRLSDFRKQFAPLLSKLSTGENKSGVQFAALKLAGAVGDSESTEALRIICLKENKDSGRRTEALAALIAGKYPQVREVVSALLADTDFAQNQKGVLLGSLVQIEEPWVADAVLASYAKLPFDMQPRAVELLTARANWAHALLDAVADQRVSAAAINVNQVRKLLSSSDQALVDKVRARWGAVRMTRDPAREQVIAAMRVSLRKAKGDPERGQMVFKRVCGQCHKIYGEGQEVGPDITVNGRSSYEQLLSNVFDPSLVIGASYQARTVVTTDGRSLTGLLAEDNDQRIVLKTQGGKLETIPRGEVDEVSVSALSLMPEGLEKQIQPEEMADLFAYITLDKPPGDSNARQLPGMRVLPPQETTDSAKFPGLVEAFAPGFSTKASGDRGVAIEAEHFGRQGVLRTHPVNQKTPCVIGGKLKIPAERKTRLVIAVSHDAQGDWQLVVKINGKTVHDSIVGPDTCHDGWRDVSIDLSEYAGKTVDVELLNQSNNWAFEYGYWGLIDTRIE